VVLGKTSFNKFYILLFLLLQIINGKYVEGFYIYARNLDSINQPSYIMLTVLNGGSGGATTCTISGLQKYTRYEFFILPFYKNVDGKPSNSRIARTMEDGERK
jgi:roundabout, axon guidance receptor 2